MEEDDVLRGHLCQSPVVCHLSQTTTASSASQTSAAHYSTLDRCSLSSESDSCSSSLKVGLLFKNVPSKYTWAPLSCYSDTKNWISLYSKSFGSWITPTPSSTYCISLSYISSLTLLSPMGGSSRFGTHQMHVASSGQVLKQQSVTVVLPCLQYHHFHFLWWTRIV